MAINNQAFYDNQFQKLLQQDADFEAKTLQAQQAKNAAINAPREPWNPLDTDWSWANDGQGLPEVVVNEGVDFYESLDPSFSLNFGLTPESSNQDMLRAVQGLDEYQNEGSQEQFNNWINNGVTEESFDWANIGDPTNVSQGTDPSVLTHENQIFIQSIYDNAYTNNNVAPNGRPSAAFCYANPANYASSTGYNNTTAGDQ